MLRKLITKQMERWELDFEWLRVQHLVKDAMNKERLPDLNAILFLIGVQELGRVQPTFSKEEKQDLMHIAVCQLLSEDGYFEFEGRDADGWPHYKSLQPLNIDGVKAQELLLKEKVIAYFKENEL
ncbi:MAG: hypothetical protein AAGG68_15750 [Bacteroidota bacterium]